MKSFSYLRRTYCLDGKCAVPVKQNDKMKWIYVLPEIYNQIIEKTDHEQNYTHKKDCKCIFCKWLDEEIINKILTK